MAYKKLLVSSITGLLLTSTAAMADPVIVGAPGAGQGQIRFIGSVIDAACSIDQDKTTQEVDFGQVSSKALMAGTKVGPEEVVIQLKDCVLDTDPTSNPNAGSEAVKVTFTGQKITDETFLNVSGVDGVGISMVDWKNTPVKWGTEGDAHSYVAGDNTLIYNSFLNHLTGTTVTTGDFVAVTNFTLSYE